MYRPTLLVCISYISQDNSPRLSKSSVDRIFALLSNGATVIDNFFHPRPPLPFSCLHEPIDSAMDAAPARFVTLKKTCSNALLLSSHNSYM